MPHTAPTSLPVSGPLAESFAPPAMHPAASERRTGLPVVVASLVIHVGAAWALGWIQVPVHAAVASQAFVEFSVPAAPAAIPEPVVTPEAPPEPLAAPVVHERRMLEPTEVAEAEPTPVAEPAALPPSLEDVFGEEPAAAAPTLVAEGAGAEGFAVDPGQAGGVPGGHGTGTAAAVGGTSSAHEAVAAGPSQADVRRARRAYVRSLEGLLGGRVHYPRAALRDRLEGRVEVCLRVGENGEILGRRVCGSAGAAVLDDAALAAATELSRVPAPPSLAAWSPSDEIHAGIAFVIR